MSAVSNRVLRLQWNVKPPSAWFHWATSSRAADATACGWTPTPGRSDSQSLHRAKPLHQVIEQEHLTLERADQQ